MDYQKLAADILKNVGGKENINTAWHCATRIRFKLTDEKKQTLKQLRIWMVLSQLFNLLVNIKL